MEPRQKKMTKTETNAESESKQLLPGDLVLEIVARCPTIDAVIRCAATSKPVRRGILHAPFLRHLRGFLLRHGREHGYGRPFIRSLLLGLYHQSEDPHRPPAFVPAADGARYPPSVAELPPAPERDDAGGSACDFGPYLPVASRRSLVVLRRRCKTGIRSNEHAARHHGVHPAELFVCNPTTGERWVLPPLDVLDKSHVVLDVNPIAPSSFKLLVAELTENDPRTLFVQIFSSEHGEWGPPLACPIPRSCEFAGAGRPRPVALGDTVHWLCATMFGDRVLKYGRRGGVAHQTSLVRLPPGCESWLGEKCLAVQPSTDGAAGLSQALLSLIVLQRGAIEVWVREKDAARSTWSWELWHHIQEASIPRPVGWLRGAEASWFCEGSGMLFLRAGDGTMSPLLLDLDSMEVRKLEATAWERNPEPEFCPYEVDLLSYMLFVMKRY